MIVQLDNNTEQFLADGGGPPTACVGYFGDQSADVEPFQESSDPGRPGPQERGWFVIEAQPPSNVAVVKSTQQMVALEHCLKQPKVLAGSRIKAGIASLSNDFSLSESCYLLVGRRGVVDDREGFQVAAVGGSGHTFEVVEISDTFVHGTPDHLRSPVSRAPAADAKLTRIVDHGLDPQDLAELVVHLQPVVFHAMFDAGPWSAVLLRVGEDFALKIPVQLAAQEGENVRAPKLTVA